jgi:hypothetical protein
VKNAVMPWFAAAVLAAGLMLVAAPTQAAMFRCPSPFGDGTVVTNGLDEAAAAERGCAALQARRSTLDGPLKPAARAQQAADDWVAPRKTASKPVAPTGAAAPAAAAAPAQRERISAATQRERDSDRRSILEDELQREQAARQSAEQRAAAADAATRDPLRAQVERHASNVDALKREIARLR